MKKVALVLALITTALISVNPAPAIAGGDKYQDLQTLVKYRILKPANTLGLNPWEPQRLMESPQRSGFIAAPLHVRRLHLPNTGEK